MDVSSGLVGYCLVTLYRLWEIIRVIDRNSKTVVSKTAICCVNSAE